MKASLYSRIIAAIFISWLVLAGGLDATASENNCTVLLYQSSNLDPEPDVLPDEDGHRMPPKPRLCTITEDGISIPGVDLASVISFDIFDDSDNLLATFPDQTGFVEFIFRYEGALTIRIVLEDYSLIGHINIGE